MIRIPSTLQEALQELESQLSVEDKEKILAMEEWEYIRLSKIYISDKLKMQWLRSQDSLLKKFFKAEGLFHEDDMSDIILRSFYRHLKGEDIRYEEQLETKPRYKQPGSL